jgi:twitching motility protein PilT
MTATPMTRILLELANAERVSDVLFREGQPPWYRIAGKMRPTEFPVVQRAQIVEMLREVEAQTSIAVQRLEESLNKRGDLDFSFSVDAMRFRANLYRTNGRLLAVALRKLHDVPPELSALALPEAWSTLVNRSKGLLLVTGATGSGKSTTLASTLAHFNRTRSGHIITLEDPIEYVLHSEGCLIDQRQVGQDARDYQTGLRAALREAPDIILVGEMRDRETVETALAAANTGHLVLSTLHTMNARQSVERIVSFFEKERHEWAYQVLSQVLLGVLSQVLLAHAVPEQGRILAAELMVNTPAVAAAIREGRTHQIFPTMDTGSSDGHVLLNRALRKLVVAGKTTVSEALYYAYDPQGLEKELRRA